MPFWVYEDIPTNHVAVHAAHCGFCNHGTGTKRVKKHPNESCWLGPYEDLSTAEAAAKSRHRPANTHTCCGEKATRRQNSTYTRFQLPTVDESSLTLDELFHHRMLQIYVVLRDEVDYKAVRFLRAVKTHGGVEHAKRALRRPAVMQSGLQRLKDEGRLHQSMEAFVISDQFAPLFTQSEVAEAKRRLAALV